MGFSTNTFLFLFLPITILVYFAFHHHMVKSKSFTAGNIVIAIASFIFYSWALFINAAMLLVYTIIIYLLGLFIGKNIQRKTKGRLRVSTVIMIAGLVFAIYLLFHFRYLPVIAPSISHFTVPLGISFITFSSVSYLVDINEKKAPAGSFIGCFMYIFYFPKIISGPVVSWHDFEPQIKYHPTSSADFVNGINRIIIGLAKKVILADSFGAFVNTINYADIDVPTAWMGWLAYALQIYLDFSGYSDIAIGLSEIFGISFKENFNFPYRSLSISEFWRRWHISLGSFFREYVYIPLGGNRKGSSRTLINLGVVFLLTGIWHGAGIAYILWGAVHGVCVIIERLIRDKKWYKKIPKAIKWLITFFIAASLWQIFRFGDLTGVVASFKQMFGACSYAYIEKTWQYFATSRLITFFIIGLLGSTLLGSPRLAGFYSKIREKYAFYVIQEILLLCLFIVSVAFMINSTYSPFIYFQF